MPSVGLGPIPHDPRRKLPRHPTDVVSCPLGKVVDLSGSGMRVHAEKRSPLKIGQIVPIKLSTPNGSISVNGKLIWKKGRGLMGMNGSELGFDFIGLKPAQTIALATIARFGFITASNVHAAEAEQAGKDPNAQASAKPGGDPQQVEASLVMAEYYEKLGVEPGVDLDQLKKAFHDAARTCHPDVAPGPDSAKRFSEVREAYDLLREHLKQAG